LQSTFRVVRRRADAGRESGGSSGYELAMAVGLARPDPDSMKKRVIAASLWFYTGWYGGATIALALGLSPALGPILAAAAALIVAGDPRRLIWVRSSQDSRAVASSPARPLA
jgi:hypothetical protein